MEALVFIGIILVILVGLWILESLVDGAVEGLFKLIKAPFEAAGKAREKNKLDTYINGLDFDTSTPPDRLHKALADHFHKGEFHPMNKVLVETDEPGRFVIGIAWHEEVRFNLEGPDGEQRTAQGSGLPVVVAELTFGARGQGTAGRMRLTRFPHERDWPEEAVMESVFPWFCEPIVKLDPSARIHKHQDASTASPAAPAFQPPGPAHQSPKVPAAHGFTSGADARQQPSRPSIARPQPPNQPADGQPASQAAVRFNPPPNWPAPPKGWTPPPDWEPDPSWPPAPPGWQFWVSA